jgi:hypothetical protein
MHAATGKTRGQRMTKKKGEHPKKHYRRRRDSNSRRQVPIPCLQTAYVIARVPDNRYGTAPDRFPRHWEGRGHKKETKGAVENQELGPGRRPPHHARSRHSDAATMESTCTVAVCLQWLPNMNTRHVMPTEEVTKAPGEVGLQSQRRPY